MNGVPLNSDNHQRYLLYRIGSGVVIQNRANVILTTVDGGSPFEVFFIYIC